MRRRVAALHMAYGAYLQPHLVVQAQRSVLIRRQLIRNVLPMRRLAGALGIASDAGCVRPCSCICGSNKCPT